MASHFVFYKIKRIALLSTLSVLFLLGLIPICKSYAFFQCDKFSLSEIVGTWENGENVFCHEQDSSLFEAPQFAEEFTYLGKGMQCFVFESKDRSLVLKFFRFKRYRIPEWLNGLPFPPFLKTIQNERIALKKKRLREQVESCTIAFQDLKEETGLLYLHLAPTTTIHKRIIIKDRLGRPYQIDLDKTLFLVQKKGELFFRSLKKKIATQNYPALEKSLTSMIHLLETIYQKNINAQDLVFKKNAGFLEDDRAILIDVGQFAKGGSLSSEEMEKSLYQCTCQLREWLTLYAPDHLAFFDSKMKEALTFCQNSNSIR